MMVVCMWESDVVSSQSTAMTTMNSV